MSLAVYWKLLILCPIFSFIITRSLVYSQSLVFTSQSHFTSLKFNLIFGISKYLFPSVLSSACEVILGFPFVFIRNFLSSFLVIFPVPQSEVSFVRLPMPTFAFFTFDYLSQNVSFHITLQFISIFSCIYSQVMSIWALVYLIFHQDDLSPNLFICKIAIFRSANHFAKFKVFFKAHLILFIFSIKCTIFCLNY